MEMGNDQDPSRNGTGMREDGQTQSDVLFVEYVIYMRTGGEVAFILNSTSCGARRKKSELVQEIIHQLELYFQCATHLPTYQQFSMGSNAMVLQIYVYSCLPHQVWVYMIYANTQPIGIPKATKKLGVGNAGHVYNKPLHAEARACVTPRRGSCIDKQAYHPGYTRLTPTTRLTRASMGVRIPRVPSLPCNNRDDASPLLGLIVSEPIVGDGTEPVANVLATLESSANPTAGGLYW